MHIIDTIQPHKTLRDEAFDFTGVKAITIYMGDTCNFDCVYCDREYIKSVIGSQNLLRKDMDQVVNFMEVAFDQSPDLTAISFHGGEPFLYIKRIDEYMEKLEPLLRERGIEVYITTNGSMIAENEWFFEKWKGIIHITLSYDFNYQEINRERVDLKELSEVIYRNNCYLWLTSKGTAK